MQSPQITNNLKRNNAVIYIILTTIRTGSTMLSDMLHNEGIFQGHGLPSNEFFHFTRMENIKSSIEETSIEQFVYRLLDEQSVGHQNKNVCGLKILKSQMKEIEHFQHSMTIEQNNGTALLSRIFTYNPKFIFLRRDNKLRQAISWIRAEKEGLWHRRSLKSFLRFLFRSYSISDIENRITKIRKNEDWIMSFFEKYKINPLIIHYENIISNYRMAVQSVFDYLGIEFAKENRAETKYKKISGLKTSLIAYRFRKKSNTN
jgi:trehalose 2-sulfotransferase